MIRDANDADIEALAALIAELGFFPDPAHIRNGLAAFAARGETVLLAEEEDGPVGCLSWHVTPAIHRAGPVGRITMLVVSPAYRGRGIGKALVREAEARLAARGCVLAEVTSNFKLREAHSFYERLGYQRTSYRFAKPIEDPGPASGHG
jgi:ribosomal protein S18 acetylase RimI-like enzyme